MENRLSSSWRTEISSLLFQADAVQIDLHLFMDASEVAYAAVT